MTSGFFKRRHRAPTRKADGPGVNLGDKRHLDAIEDGQEGVGLVVKKKKANSLATETTEQAGRLSQSFLDK